MDLPASRLLFLTFASGLPLVAGGAYFQNSGQQVTTGNSRIQLVFNAASGSLVNLIDQATSQDFLPQKTAYYNGFTFSYVTPGNSAMQNGGGYLAQSVTFTPSTTGTGINVSIQFNKFFVNGLPLNISATLTIAVDNVSPLTTWNLTIANQDQITIETVQLPYLTGLAQMSSDPANDYLVYPSLSGMLFQDPVHNLVLNRGWGYQQYYPGGYDNMQFMAYYSRESGAGLYIASQDIAGYTKYLNSALPNINWFELDDTYAPVLQPGMSVAVPYPVVVGFFQGDWFDAASLYRAWAIQQPWAQAGPLATRTDVPEWYKKSGMIAWMLTVTQFAADGQSYADLAKVAAAWQQDLHSKTIMDWTEWENQGAWLDIPNFLPPSQGWPAFDSTVSTTHAAGSTLMVEPSTSYATLGAPGWTMLQSAASEDPSGAMYLNQFSTLNQSGENQAETVAQMDPTQAWHDALLSFTTPLQQNGIDLIHMDGNPFRKGLCYATNHSHPPGGGNWWFQGLAQIYSDIRTAGRAVNPNFAMGGEFYAEPFLALTDSGQDETNTGLDPSGIAAGAVKDSSKVSYIPLWQAVYHDYTLTYSTISFIDGTYSPYYRRGLAMSLVWGEIPMILGENSDATPWLINGFDRAQLQYLRRIVALRTSYGYPFVVLGRMLRPPAPAVPAYTIPPVQDIPYTQVNTSAFNAPSVLSSAWQSPAGDAALIFTNISDGVVPFSWTVSNADVPLESGKEYNLYTIRNGLCISADAGVHLPYTLNLSADSTDVLMALFSQSDAPMRCRIIRYRFPGKG